ncbi:MAG TPA: glycosyltransferase family 4 protein [Longimicrobiales bacterium]|nr:glycosyltransferase family 4 protein [Longimicrobiales bacterium]
MHSSDAAVRRRILLVGPLPPPSHGVAVLTRTLLESPLARRFELLHLDTADRRGVANIGRLDVGNVWLAGLHGARFLALLARQQIDMVYLPLSKNTLGFLRDSLFLVPALARGTRVVVHLHGSGFDQFVASAPAAVRALVRLLLRQTTVAIVLGEALKPMLRGMIPDSRIVVVPNGVPDLRGVAAYARPQDGPMRILFLGNLLPSKGYVELLEAVQALLDEGHDIAVTFAGSVVDSGVHRHALATVRYGEDRILFAGPVDAETKAALLRQADLLVLPSDDEAQPLVILEAMAAGLPVVSTRRGAIPETVVDGETGVLIDKRDAAALADVLRELGSRPEYRSALGTAARERYLACYTVDQWSDRMAAVFNAALEVSS